jgi:hypothetical protein
MSDDARYQPAGLAAFFLLMYTGMLFAVLGPVHREALLVGMGAVFMLAPIYAFRSTIPLSVSAWALVGMLIGALLGAGLGASGGDVARAQLGIIAAAVLGATLGATLLVGVVSAVLGIPFLPGVNILELPRSVALALTITGAVAGAIIGAIGLRETIITVFGPIGCGAVALGSLGLMLSLYLGRKRLDNP